MNMMEDMALDAEAVSNAVNVNAESMSRIAVLAKRQITLAAQCEKMEEALKAVRAELETVSTKDLPDALAEVGMSEFKMESGEKITVKPFYSAKINDANREQCFTWLEDNGHGDLIKHSISVILGKGEQEVAEQVTQALSLLNITPKVDLSVHSSTLTAFIREQVEGGQEFPLDLFNTYIGRKAVIKA